MPERNQTADRATRKVLKHLLPVAMLMFFMSFIDRTNIAYAALQMNGDLGFTPSVYGLGAGIFFLGYFIFEIPSNLVMLRVGARRWLARIMISWGAVVVAMAWVNDARSFYVVRFLLGVAEAGLLPGLLYYLGSWVPLRQRGLAYSMLLATTALSNILSGPIATSVMQHSGFLELRGWQLLFWVEGVPTVVLGFCVLKLLPEDPSVAKWLASDEREWLSRTIASERRDRAEFGATSLRQGFSDPRVLLITLVSFFFVTCNFGTVFWLPQIIKSLTNVGNVEVGLIAAIPYILGGLATLLWGIHSDRTDDRRWHLVIGAATGAVGYTWAAMAATPFQSFIGICVATLGIWSMFGVFWALAADLLGGAAAAAGFALINSVAALGGFLGPVLIGFLREHTQSFRTSLLALAGFAAITAALALLLRNYGIGRSSTSPAPAVRA